MKAIDRLRFLAGPGGTAGDALKRIGGSAGIAGALLVAYSGLPSATAAQHLMTDVVIVTLPGQDGGSAPHGPKRDYLSENLLRQSMARDLAVRAAVNEYNLTRLHADDQTAIELIVAILQMELMDG